MMTNPLKLTQRLSYFTVIGASAASVHLLSVLSLVTYLQIPPLVANMLAFLLAFNVSFLGHRRFTFAKLHDLKRLRLPHFFLVAASAGLINESLYYLLLQYTMLNYLFALVLVIGLMSIYSFVLSRFWACR